MNETECTVVGWVATPPREAFDKYGGPIASFRLGTVPRKWTRDNGWQDGPASFYTVSCFRTLARNVLGSLSKHDPVIVRGRLRINEWSTTDGRRGTSGEIEALAVGHNLQRGTSSFLWAKVAASQPATPGEDAADGLRRAVEGEPVDLSPARSDWTPGDDGYPGADDGFGSSGTTLDPTTGELTTPASGDAETPSPGAATSGGGADSDSEWESSFESGFDAGYAPGADGSDDRDSSTERTRSDADGEDPGTSKWRSEAI